MKDRTFIALVLLGCASIVSLGLVVVGKSVRMLAIAVYYLAERINGIQAGGFF